MEEIGGGEAGRRRKMGRVGGGRGWRKKEEEGVG